MRTAGSVGLTSRSRVTRLAAPAGVYTSNTTKITTELIKLA